MFIYCLYVFRNEKYRYFLESYVRSQLQTCLISPPGAAGSEVSEKQQQSEAAGGGTPTAAQEVGGEVSAGYDCDDICDTIDNAAFTQPVDLTTQTEEAEAAGDGDEDYNEEEEESESDDDDDD